MCYRFLNFYTELASYRHNKLAILTSLQINGLSEQYCSTFKPLLFGLTRLLRVLLMNSLFLCSVYNVTPNIYATFIAVLLAIGCSAKRSLHNREQSCMSILPLHHLRFLLVSQNMPKAPLQNCMSPPLDTLRHIIEFYRSFLFNECPKIIFSRQYSPWLPVWHMNDWHRREVPSNTFACCWILLERRHPDSEG